MYTSIAYIVCITSMDLQYVPYDAYTECTIQTQGFM